jgi:tripartite-type tricarboxylate transporter receptor subunit TctC
MSESMGQTFYVDNKPGASTVIGSEYVAKSAPDGYTLLVASVPHATNPSMMKNLPFDTVKAFAPVSLAVQSPFIMVSSSTSSIHSMDEALAQARRGACRSHPRAAARPTTCRWNCSRCNRASR